MSSSTSAVVNFPADWRWVRPKGWRASPERVVPPLLEEGSQLGHPSSVGWWSRACPNAMALNLRRRGDSAGDHPPRPTERTTPVYLVAVRPPQSGPLRLRLL